MVFSPHGARLRRRNLTVIEDIHSRVYAAPRQPVRTAKRILLCILLLAILTIVIWSGRETLLRGAAELWIVSDPVAPADAVAVLGGGLSVRPFAAAKYYQKGLVKKILVANVHHDEAETRGIVPSHTDLNRNALINLGVPETAIEIIGRDVSNTYQEVVALREWAVRTHSHSIIVPTEIFSSRRVRWILEHAFRDTGVKIQVPAFDSPEYNRDEWWRNEQGLVIFQNEVIKYVYYRFKY